MCLIIFFIYKEIISTLKTYETESFSRGLKQYWWFSLYQDELIDLRSKLHNKIL